jgi:hypothetical protein
MDMINRKIDGPTTTQFLEAQQNNVVVFGADINFYRSH